MPLEHDVERTDQPGSNHDPAGQGVTPDRAAQLADRELRHELRNALAAALGYSALLQRHADAWENEEDRRALNVVLESLGRARRLLWTNIEDEAVDEMRDAPRDPPELRRLVAAAVSQVPPQRFGDVVVRILTEDPLVGDWDGEQLMQVLINLLDNAVKYSPCGSPIVVEFGRCGDRARVVVRDRGIGIAPGEIDAIFEGHRTARAREISDGSGIGLRLSRRLIEAHGGVLGVVSERDGGSAFWLELPLTQ